MHNFNFRNCQNIVNNNKCKWKHGDYICFNSLVLNWRLPFWNDSIRLLVSSWNLPFEDYPGLNVRSLWIFQVDQILKKNDLKILAARNEIKCVRCSRLPSYMSSRFVSIKARIVLAQAKEAPGTSLRIKCSLLFLNNENCFGTK